MACESSQKFWSEVRKFRTKSKLCEIDSTRMFDHFKTLFPSDNVFTTEESFLNDDNFDTISVFELDRDFTIYEVQSAISCLKSGKSGGVDNLLPEMVLECKSILSQ